jgi:hypothetical protein
MAQTPLQPNYMKVFIQRDYSEGKSLQWNARWRGKLIKNQFFQELLCNSQTDFPLSWNQESTELPSSGP